MTHPGAGLRGKNGQVDQWCMYFARNSQSLAPMKKALSKLQGETTLLANLSSQRAAVSEEIDARSQLQKTVEQDIRSLSSLLDTLRKSSSTSSLQALERKATRSKEVLLKLGAATEGWRGAHIELEDALEATLHSRSAVVESQRSKLALLQKIAQE